MADRPYNVLFLCTDKSARSTIAEALINQWGRGKFRGLSAGSHPKGTVHPPCHGNFSPHLQQAPQCELDRPVDRAAHSRVIP
jgi:hypothetical protein